MKIDNSSPTAIQPTTRTELKAVDRLERVGSTRDGVSLSADAQWVNAIKDEVKREPEIRTDVVDKMKEALAAGTYESSVDMDTLVTNFLADL